MDGPCPDGRVLVLALALLLALSPLAVLSAAAPAARPASAAPATASSGPFAAPVVPQNGTTAYLTVPAADVERTELVSVGLDASGSAAVDQARLASRLTEYRTEAAFKNASNVDQRRAAIRVGLDRLETRAAQLERRERAALAAFNDGRLSTEAYLRELAAVDAGASSLASTATRLYQYTQSVPSSAVSPGDIAAVKARLLGLDGPVRSEVGRLLTGSDAPSRIYVETSGTGVVLSTLAGDEFSREYVREAYLPDSRAESASDRYFENGQYDLETAENRVRDLYPWVFENHGGISTGLRTGQPYLYRAAVYSVAVDHDQGTARQGDLVVFLDGGTGEVFREVQYKDLSDIPTAPATGVARNVSDGLVLEVNRTREGAPVAITVREAVAGAPVSARVSIDGVPLGGTGFDGRLWAITPRSAFTVTAEVGNRTVSAGPMFPRQGFEGFGER